MPTLFHHFSEARHHLWKVKIEIPHLKNYKNVKKSETRELMLSMIVYDYRAPINHHHCNDWSKIVATGVFKKISFGAYFLVIAYILGSMIRNDPLVCLINRTFFSYSFIWLIIFLRVHYLVSLPSWWYLRSVRVNTNHLGTESNHTQGVKISQKMESNRSSWQKRH